MKLPTPFTICDLRFAIWKKSPGGIVGQCRWGERPREPKRGDKAGSSVASPHLAAIINHQSSIVNRKSTAGVALVITLILLSVTLIMAVAFVARRPRHRKSLTTPTATPTP